MRLLMTADAVGGVWTYALSLCAALAKHDIQIVLATLGPRPSGAQREAAAASANVQLVESDYRLEWMQDPWADVAAAGEWLLALADRSRVDLVHVNGYAHAALRWERPVVCVAHSCVYSWWQAVHGCTPPAEWMTYRTHVMAGLAHADRIVVPSAAFLDQLRACYGISHPANVIHNANVRVAQSGQALTERLPVILACGRPWDVSKDISTLDAAAASLRWRSYVIGATQGPDGEEFSPATIRILGKLSAHDVEEWLSRASIFVHPAVYEPFGLAVLEAASAGCALVLADIPTLRELWDGAAEFFAPRDSEDLRAVLERLISQPTQRRRLAEAAMERARNYRSDAMGEAYARMYRTLLSQRASMAKAVA